MRTTRYDSATPDALVDRRAGLPLVDVGAAETCRLPARISWPSRTGRSRFDRDGCVQLSYGVVRQTEANGARWPSRSSKSVAARVERAGWVRLPGASATLESAERGFRLKHACQRHCRRVFAQSPRTRSSAPAARAAVRPCICRWRRATATRADCRRARDVVRRVADDEASASASTSGSRTPRARARSPPAPARFRSAASSPNAPHRK